MTGAPTHCRSKVGTAACAPHVTLALTPHVTLRVVAGSIQSENRAHLM